VIEVFKTNVQEDEHAEKLIKALSDCFPNSRITFDLEDCYRVLRVAGDDVCPQKTIALLSLLGFEYEALI
jgi:predicted RNA binding protein with dsRBD fold (UPF0201 family)